MKRLSALSPPSDLARCWTETCIENPTFLNQCPSSAEGMPMALLHPVFGHFDDDCDNVAVNGDDYKFVFDIHRAMCDYYANEKERLENFKMIFMEYFGLPLKRI